MPIESKPAQRLSDALAVSPYCRHQFAYDLRCFAVVYRPKRGEDAAEASTSEHLCPSAHAAEDAGKAADLAGVEHHERMLHFT